MLKDVFNDKQVIEFKNEHNLSDNDLNNFFSELVLFVKDKEAYDLGYNNGYIELISKEKEDVSGITYLDQIYFDKPITINDVDVKSNPKKASFIKHVLEGGRLNNFFLTGSNGIGKTFITLALANFKYEKTEIKTMYVFWPDFIEKSKNFKDNNAHTINKVKYYHSLIIDDLGQESISQWSRDDILNPIIAYRLSKNLDTYITSNYSLDELKELYTLKKIDAKKARSIVSKIEGLAPQVPLDGVDLRNNK